MLFRSTEKLRGEIEATKTEYAAVLSRLDSQAAAEQKKIDEQRANRAATLERACSEQTTKIRDDAEFERGSLKEVFKEKRNDPQKLLAKTEKDYARFAAQFDEVLAKAREFARKAGVKGDTPAADRPLPEGEPLVAELEAAHAGALAAAKEIIGLESSKTIFGGLKKEAAARAAELLAKIGRAHV